MDRMPLTNDILARIRKDFSGGEMIMGRTGGEIL